MRTFCILLFVMGMAMASGCVSEPKRGSLNASGNSSESSEIASLRATVEQQALEIAELRDRLDAATRPSGDSATNTEEIEKAVTKILEERESEQQAELEQQRSAAMREMRQRMADRALTTLRRELELSDEQAAAILESFRLHLEERHTLAQRRLREGTAFDDSFRKEADSANRRYTHEVRSQLTAEQKAKFDKLTGDDGLLAEVLTRRQHPSQR